MGQRYGDNAGGNSGVCVGEEPKPDGGPDMMVERVCYGAQNGLAKPCFRPAPTGDLTLPAAINTTNDPLCSTDVMDVPASLCVIGRANINVAAGATVIVTGDRPLVLVATGTISITGTLEAASRRSTTNLDQHGLVGAGSDPTTGCQQGTQPGISGGGAGGTFVALGGGGGGGNGGGAGGAAGTPQAIALRGGCRGQNATGTGGGATTAQGGNGGGALYLIAAAINIEGTLNASGEGGHRGLSGNNSPGGGGGSGGLIGLDALTISNNGLVFANGGGGGEGSGNGISGNPGADPTSAAPAAGGINGGGGNGGPGGAGGVSGGTTNGGNGSNAPADGGGGGGGGAGVIKVFRSTLDGQYSPNPTP